MGMFDGLFKRKENDLTKKSGISKRKKSNSRNTDITKKSKKRIEYCPPNLRGICAGCGKDGRPYFRSTFGSIVSGDIPFAVCEKCGRTWCRKCWKDGGFLTYCPTCGGTLKK